MITFAFVVLSLVLFGAALYFAARDFKREQDAKRELDKAETQRLCRVQRTDISHLDKMFVDQQLQIRSLSEALQNLPKSDGSKPTPVPGPKDNFSKMEDRYAEQFKKTVVVDGIEQPTAEA